MYLKFIKPTDKVAIWKLLEVYLFSFRLQKKECECWVVSFSEKEYPGVQTSAFALKVGWVLWSSLRKPSAASFVLYLQMRKRTGLWAKWRSKGRWVRTVLITPQVMDRYLPGDAGFGFVHFPVSGFLAAVATFTQLPESAPPDGILQLISCLVQFRMHEAHLRRIYKVSQFIQGIPSWITL